MSTGKLNDLAVRPVGSLLWEYSIPAVVGMLVMALYNVVDRVFIGQVVGPEAIAGLSITFPVMNITTAIGVLVGVGSSTRISISLGGGNRSRAEQILGNAATLTVINGALYIICFLIWLDPILYLFGAGDATLPYARTYMLWVLPGLFLTNVAFGLNNVLRASGYPNLAMMTMLIGAISNILLDALFVLVFDWGMIGAAIATDIAMAISAVFVIVHFLKPNVNLGFKKGTFGLQKNIVYDIISIGMAPSIVNVASCFINALINQALRDHGGDMAIGAAGIFVTYTSLLTTVVLGICMGLQPIVGYNYGAGRLDRLKRALLIASAVSTVICTIGSVVGLWLPDLIARAFTADDFLVSTTVNCLRNAVWAFSIVGIPIVATTFFQSLGKPGKALFLSLARQVIFLIPLMLMLPKHFGVNGVWLSFPISDIFATLTTAIMLVVQFRQINHELRSR